MSPTGLYTEANSTMMKNPKNNTTTSPTDTRIHIDHPSLILLNKSFYSLLLTLDSSNIWARKVLDDSSVCGQHRRQNTVLIQQSLPPCPVLTATTPTFSGSQFNCDNVLLFCICTPANNKHHHMYTATTQQSMAQCTRVHHTQYCHRNSNKTASHLFYSAEFTRTATLHPPFTKKDNITRPMNMFIQHNNQTYPTTHYPMYHKHFNKTDAPNILSNVIPILHAANTPNFQHFPSSTSVD